MRKLGVLTIVAMLCPLGVLLVQAGNEPDNALDQIARHRQWTRVTPEPFAVIGMPAAAI